MNLTTSVTNHHDVRHARTTNEPNYHAPNKNGSLETIRSSRSPGNASDVKSGQRRDTYQRLKKLGTKAYDTREIIYYKRELTQKELKEELRTYGYEIQHSNHPGTDALDILKEETGEITTRGSNNDKIITWTGENSKSSSCFADGVQSDRHEKDRKTDKTAISEESSELIEIVSGSKSGQNIPGFPVSEKYEVIGGENVHKDDGWWKAIVLYDDDYGTKIAMYSWQNSGGTWKKRQKYRIWSEDEWERIKQITERTLEKAESLSG